ncbi:hypothetical protein [Salimicrobium album]|uniref:Uncharacterized protein n=1 Tax=Salimicrobium album TaxID=50717 RepID=A0A1H3GGK3_9BACI|nr:hypothetical protein [Salimicrobium album]SDY01634.1 hypothetical protein SAMN04488081_1903 [Salimicrobium album]
MKNPEDLAQDYLSRLIAAPLSQKNVITQEIVYEINHLNFQSDNSIIPEKEKLKIPEIMEAYTDINISTHNILDNNTELLNLIKNNNLIENNTEILDLIKIIKKEIKEHPNEYL